MEFELSGNFFNVYMYQSGFSYYAFGGGGRPTEGFSARGRGVDIRSSGKGGYYDGRFSGASGQ